MNAYHASAEGQQAMVMAKETRKMTVTKCPTYGEFFERFVKGLHKRMGEIVRPYRALALDILLIIFRILEEEWSQAGNEDRKFDLAMEGSFYLIAFCCALRGEEVPLADMYGMIKHREDGERAKEKHVVVVLLGRFKGETGENYHLMPIVDVTSHGLEPKKWIGRLLDIYASRGVNHGPLFRNRSGQRMKSSMLEPKFFERLELVKDMYPQLMSSVDEISEEYGVYRSFRRGATSEAVNAGVSPVVIDANNRWRKMHHTGASKPTMMMREHYTDVRLTLNQCLKFSRAL